MTVQANPFSEPETGVRATIPFAANTGRVSAIRSPMSAYVYE